MVSRTFLQALVISFGLLLSVSAAPGQLFEEGERSGERSGAWWVREVIESHRVRSIDQAEVSDSNLDLSPERVVSFSQEHGSVSLLLEQAWGVVEAATEKLLGRGLRAAIQRRDILGGLLNCDTCDMIVSLAQSLLASNTSVEDIKNSVKNVCNFLHVETPRVCEGIVEEFAPELLPILQQLPSGSGQICGFMLEGCGGDIPGWNVSLPSVPQPPPREPVLPKAGLPTLRVLHLTDVHWDPDYREGSNANCDEPLCCRDPNVPLADGSDGAWKFGDYRSCDTPLWTLEDMFATLARQNDSFDYVIWTGDIPAHNVWNQSREDQLYVINTVIGLFNKYLPGKPVFPSLGNHESTPVNSFPPPYITGENSIDWLYQALADGWKQWLPQSAISSVRKGAYYIVSPYPGLKIISLNMNYCNNMNWWMLLNTTDPAGELEWLVAELQKAEDNNEKVHILGHIPPGSGDCIKPWSWNFYKIVSRYQNTIAGQFFGHTHKDEFVLFYDVETLQRPVSVAYIAPSVTSYSNLNMGYRFYTLDGAHPNSSYQVLDHQTFYLNLTKAQIEGKPTWEFEYSAKAAYNLPSLFPRDWNNFLNVLKTNDTILQSYSNHYTKLAKLDKCDADCRKNFICSIRSGRSSDPSLCKDVIEREDEFYEMLRRQPKHC